MLDASVLDLDFATEQFRKDVVLGLSRAQKDIPAKYFYDAEGSRLFEQICRLPEYYPTRTEMEILRLASADIARHLPRQAVLIEFGSGASTKVRQLLHALEQPACYAAIDISVDYLRSALPSLSADFPGLRVIAVGADFSQSFDMPLDVPESPRVGFFPGSTIGNFSPPEAQRLLAHFAHHLGTRGLLLVGVDLKKNAGILHAAYNDASGITAAFNLNLLVRINRQLGGQFNLSHFAHEAFYNADEGRIEMHLRSLRTQTIPVAGRMFRFAADETIHTENSYKYSIAEFQALAVAAGYHPLKFWTDPNPLFSVHLLRVDRS